MNFVTRQGASFLEVKHGDYVVVEDRLRSRKYIGYVLKCIGGSRNPKNWTLFQVFDVDKGFVEIIHASYVINVVLPVPNL